MPWLNQKDRQEELEEQKNEKFKELEGYVQEQVEAGIHTPEFIHSMKSSWLVSRGASLAENESLELARKDFLDAYSISPDDLNIRAALSSFYRVVDEPKEALKVINGTTKTQVKDAIPWTKIGFFREAGIVYLVNNQIDKAEKSFKLALKVAEEEGSKIQEEMDFAQKAGLDLGDGVNIAQEVADIKEILLQIKLERANG